MISTESQNTTSPKFDKKLDTILAASAKVFAKDGYEKASIRQIASELNVSYAGLYHYISSKEELLFQIQYRTFSSLLDKLKDKIAKIANPEEKLQLMISNHLEHFMAHMDELAVCTHELKTLEGDYYNRVFEKRKSYFLETLNIVKEIGAKAKESGINAGIATLYLFGMLNWIYMWYDPVRNSSPKQLTDQMTALFLNGLLSGNLPDRIDTPGNFLSEV